MRGIAKGLAQYDCYFARPSCRIVIIVANMFMSGTMARAKAALFDDAVGGVLGEVRECGCQPRAKGLWVTLPMQNHVRPEAA
jgi:hypothetical protein